MAIMAIALFLLELSQFGFISATIFVVYILLNFIIKLYGRTKLGKDTKFEPTTFEKATLWLSLAYILTFLI